MVNWPPEVCNSLARRAPTFSRHHDYRGTISFFSFVNKIASFRALRDKNTKIIRLISTTQTVTPNVETKRNVYRATTLTLKSLSSVAHP